MNTGAYKQEMEISYQLKCSKQSLVNCGNNELNARHPDVLLMTINT